MLARGPEFCRYPHPPILVPSQTTVPAWPPGLGTGNGLPCPSPAGVTVAPARRQRLQRGPVIPVQPLRASGLSPVACAQSPTRLRASWGWARGSLALGTSEQFSTC